MGPTRITKETRTDLFSFDCLRFSTLLDPNFYELRDNQKQTKILSNPRKISKNSESISEPLKLPKYEL